MQKPALSHDEKEGLERMAREKTYLNIISMLEDTAKDTSSSDQAVYHNIINRLKDMQRGSLFWWHCSLTKAITEKSKSFALKLAGLMSSEFDDIMRELRGSQNDIDEAIGFLSKEYPH